MSVGRFFQTLSANAHDRAEKMRLEQDEQRKEQVGIWRAVLENPASSEAQRQMAVDNLNKLYSLKGQKQGSPFEKLSGFIKLIGDRLQGKQQAQPGQGQAQAQPGQAQPTNQPKPQLQPLTGAPQDGTITPGKRNAGERALGKVASGLGGAMNAFSGAINPHPQEFPPLQASAFPTADQVRAEKTKDLEADLETKEKYIEKQIRLRGEEAQKTAQARATHAMNSKTKYPGNAITNALSDPSMRDKLVDANNLPIDPNGLYAPIAGEAMSIENDNGTPVLTAVRVGTGSAREGYSEQIEIDPRTNELVAVPVRRGTNTPAPPKQASPRLDGGKPSSSSNGKAHSSTLHPLNGSAGKTGTPGARTIGPYVRPQQFNPLQKQATAIDEARNSLIGDDPKQTGGLSADLDVFKKPESVDRLTNYLGFIEKNLSGEGARVAGMGPVAALEWYTGLPVAVSNLQQQAQKELALTLTPEEQKFVSDYFRVMGTIGGMRAATGMSSARWSFQTLYNELPTPGKVTDAADAKRRITNLIQETNVVAKRNPLSSKANVEDNSKSVDDEVKDLEKKLLKK
jgi:hypothetical protein